VAAISLADIAALDGAAGELFRGVDNSVERVSICGLPGNSVESPVAGKNCTNGHLQPIISVIVLLSGVFDSVESPRPSQHRCYAAETTATSEGLAFWTFELNDGGSWAREKGR